MGNRLESFFSLRKNAYQLASARGFLKKGIRENNMSQIKVRYITENIIRRTWNYHQENDTNITDGQETRLIMLNCIYAGMYAAKFPTMDEDMLLDTISQYDITSIQEYVEKQLAFNEQESFVTCLVGKGLVQDVYNDNIYLYSNYETPEGHWEYYQDIACAMFELGAIYFRNR